LRENPSSPVRARGSARASRGFSPRNGAKVTIVARHRAESEAAAQELGGDASAAIADVTNLAELEKMAKSAARRNGGIDVLGANAGIFPQARIEDMSPEQWDAVLATN
jgi:3-oxoacyl-[acyl-carrier protein] reductase